MTINIKKRWKQFSQSPDMAIRWFSIAVGLFALGLIGVYLASEFEVQWLFTISSLWMVVITLGCVPLYLAIIILRIKKSRHKK